MDDFAAFKGILLGADGSGSGLFGEGGYAAIRPVGKGAYSLVQGETIGIVGNPCPSAWDRCAG